MKRKLNKTKVLAVIVVILMVIACAFTLGGVKFYKTEPEAPTVQYEQVIEENTTNTIDTNTTEEETMAEPSSDTQEQTKIALPPIENTPMYTTTRVNMRANPSLEGEVIKVLPINTLVTKVGDIDSEWSKIKYENDEQYYYIATRLLSTEKTEIKVVEQPKVTSRSAATPRSEAPKASTAANKLTKSKGVVYFNGHKETYYSQKVLPGGGLKIPGRHVASDGTIRDENDYICVASSDYSKGTIVETSLGTGKVYDSGCASGTIDIYTNW